MSDCGVCLSGEADGNCEFYNVETRKARKQHRCCECRRDISLGEKYVVVSGKYDGDFFSLKTCSVCDEILRAFSCGGGVLHECPWEDMTDYWREWKGLTQ